MAPIPYDQRDGFIWMNGALVPWRDAKVHVLTHGLHYGSGVFEGARIYDGEVFELTQHSERLRASANILGFEIPYSAGEIDQACRDVIKAQGLVEGLYPARSRGAARRRWASPPRTRKSISPSPAGIGAPISLSRKNSRASGSAGRIIAGPTRAPRRRRAKATGLYMICTIEKHRSMDLGYADALMLDYRGLVAEATGANIFFVKGETLHTPDPECILNGITRQTVIALAKRRGLDVIVRQIKPEEMADFEQCFLTGSAAEVTPVSEIGDDRFTVGDIARALMEDYSAYARPRTRAERKLALAS